MPTAAKITYKTVLYSCIVKVDASAHHHNLTPCELLPFSQQALLLKQRNIIIVTKH